MPADAVDLEIRSKMDHRINRSLRMRYPKGSSKGGYGASKSFLPKESPEGGSGELAEFWWCFVPEGFLLKHLFLKGSFQSVCSRRVPSEGYSTDVQGLGGWWLGSVVLPKDIPEKSFLRNLRKDLLSEWDRPSDSLISVWPSEGNGVMLSKRMAWCFWRYCRG